MTKRLNTFICDDVRLDDEEIREISHGKAFAKTWDPRSAVQVIAFGVVHIPASSESYLGLVADILMPSRCGRLTGGADQYR